MSQQGNHSTTEVPHQIRSSPQNSRCMVTRATTRGRQVVHRAAQCHFGKRVPHNERHPTGDVMKFGRATGFTRARGSTFRSRARTSSRLRRDRDRLSESRCSSRRAGRSNARGEASTRCDPRESQRRSSITTAIWEVYYEVQRISGAGDNVAGSRSIDDGEPI